MPAVVRVREGEETFATVDVDVASHTTLGAIASQALGDALPTTRRPGSLE